MNHSDYMIETQTPSQRKKALRSHIFYTLWDRQGIPGLREHMRDTAIDAADAIADIILRKPLLWNPDSKGNGVTLHAYGPDLKYDGMDQVDVGLQVVRTPETALGAAEPEMLLVTAYGRNNPHREPSALGLVGQWVGQQSLVAIEYPDMDSLCNRILMALGVPDTPPAPKPGTYGPTAERMDNWLSHVSHRLSDASGDNLDRRAIEPDEECWHVCENEFVTEEQMDLILPEGLSRDRYIVMQNAPLVPEEASLHWNDPDWWKRLVHAAVSAADRLNDGVYWTNCWWEEDDYPQPAESQPDTGQAASPTTSIAAMLSDPDPATPAAPSDTTPPDTGIDI